ANAPRCAPSDRCSASSGEWRSACSDTGFLHAALVWPRGRTRDSVARSATAAAHPDRKGLGMADEAYDLIVMGSGTGGYATALRAAELDKRVAIVERADRLGGTCLLRGCIPSKALLESASVM